MALAQRAVGRVVGGGLPPTVTRLLSAPWGVKRVGAWQLQPFSEAVELFYTAGR